MKFVSGIIKL